MSKKSTTVDDLARRKGVEPDDVLIMVWDGGIGYPNGPRSIIRPQDVARAEKACGLASPKARTTVEYWIQALSLDRSELTAELRDLGIVLAPNARKLPKGALAKLERTRPRASVAMAVNVNTELASQVDDLPTFVWRDVGHIREVHNLTAKEIEGIHFAIAADFQAGIDPISPAGVRNQNLLDARPRGQQVD